MKDATPRNSSDPVHHLVLVTEGRDLLSDEVLDALYEAGCTEAPTRWDAIQSAIRDVTAVAGVKVIDARDSLDALSGDRAERALA